MTKFLCVGHTYNGVEAALFNDDKFIDKIFEDKKRASKYFVTNIQLLLSRNGWSLSDLSFIATNKGPGPFTTLRVVLASVNGLAFAIKKPIIAIDGLQAILQEYGLEQNMVTVALLDACAKDIYFGVSGKDLNSGLVCVNTGYKNIEVFLQDLKNLYINKKIYFIGNGSEKYRDQIIKLFGDSVVFDEKIPETCSIEQIGKMAFYKWEKGEGLEKQVLPVYLKSVSY
jgi:universal bacterial protein YeaZ